MVNALDFASHKMGHDESKLNVIVDTDHNCINRREHDSGMTPDLFVFRSIIMNAEHK